MPPINLFFVVLFSVLVYVILLFLCSFINHLVLGIIRVPKDIRILSPGICEYVRYHGKRGLRL